VGRAQGRAERTEAWGSLIIEDVSRPENARIVGESIAARILLVVFIERDDDLVRLISARRATRHERRCYEEGE
jgi:uncharacterized DUF497 family protein